MKCPDTELSLFEFCRYAFGIRNFQWNALRCRR
ncbi:hypothetical protein T4A_6969 [Trichinella pseudospiralis]|uniref:Uncharacterized protein n=1 Tax=Trichinella pseudospiralis TaxID=6337 RepID=A0A0V1DLY8_TRIPS|nr:hypothetical protein T4A_6969 [Trichinella pseudospiralis]